MTAILQDIKRLEESHARGDINQQEFATRKAALIANIEEAPQAELPDTAQPELPKRALFDLVLAGLLVAAACTILATYILGDFTLALTLTITVLAALTVRAFRALDD